MKLEELKSKIEELLRQYYMNLPPEHTKEGYNNFWPLAFINDWVEREKKRTEKKL